MRKDAEDRTVGKTVGNRTNRYESLTKTNALFQVAAAEAAEELRKRLEGKTRC